jgi:hypothetical protein
MKRRSQNETARSETWRVNNDKVRGRMEIWEPSKSLAEDTAWAISTFTKTLLFPRIDNRGIKSITFTVNYYPLKED